MNTPADQPPPLAGEPAPTRRGGGARWFLWSALAVILLLAALAARIASSAPDGLEAVAARLGLDSGQQDSATAGSPLADYATAGVSDPHLSGAIAGLLGVIATLAVVWVGVRWLTRPRPTANTPS